MPRPKRWRQQQHSDRAGTLDSCGDLGLRLRRPVPRHQLIDAFPRLADRREWVVSGPARLRAERQVKETLRAGPGPTVDTGGFLHRLLQRLSA